jgi:hypothetical protein
LPPDLARVLTNALARLQQIKGEEDADDAHAEENEIGLAQANHGLAAILRVVESGHREAPASALVIFDQMSDAAREKIAAWEHFKSADLAEVNAALLRADRKPLQIAAIEEQVHYAMTR